MQRAQARAAAREAAAAARAAAAAERAEQARLDAEERRAAAKARVRREREAIVARGQPPEPNRAARLPPGLLPDLLGVWELLSALASLLQARPGQQPSRALCRLLCLCHAFVLACVQLIFV